MENKMCCRHECEDQFAHNMREELLKCSDCLNTIVAHPISNYYKKTICEFHKAKYTIKDDMWYKHPIQGNSVLQWNFLKGKNEESFDNK